MDRMKTVLMRWAGSPPVEPFTLPLFPPGGARKINTHPENPVRITADLNFYETAYDTIPLGCGPARERPPMQ